MKKSSRTRKLMKSLVLSLALAAVGFAGAAFAAPSDANAAAVMASQMKNSSITELTNDTRVFKVDKKIQTKMVRFQNRYGIEVAGHLYLPEHFEKAAATYTTWRPPIFLRKTSMQRLTLWACCPLLTKNASAPWASAG